MIEAWILSFALILVRVATFWMINPVWNTLKPPRTVKLGLVLSLALFWFASLEQPIHFLMRPTDSAGYWSLMGLLVLRELLLGGILGFAFHVLFVPMQIAGAYIGQELGLSMATLTDPSSGAVNNIVATLLQAFAVCMFFVLDLHHFVIHYLDVSFQLVPPGEPWRIESVMLAGFEFAQLTEQGLLMSMPVAIVMFVALVALLVLARAVPALNLFSIGLSVRLLLGIFAILIFLPHLLAAFNAQIETGRQFLEVLLSSFQDSGAG